MEVSNQVVVPNSAAPPASQAEADQTSLASDFDTFLQLLTAQIQNQDPLNPADSTEFATQLATFSNVEQGVRTNTLLEGLVSQMSLQGLDRFAAWIGQEARTSGGTRYTGGEVTLDAEIPAIADAAQLVVTNGVGTEVGRFAIDPDSTQITVTPTGYDGAPLPDGVYGYHVEPTTAGGVLAPVEAVQYVTVVEALIEDGQPQLVLAGGTRIDVNDVTGLRAPQ